ncbi:hypothetical protein Tcan_11866 [Toxocara canis]|uniref:Uncharacterized protein n=1 Tax=Toxocara canis TaxID=6265 RepID=A0A0B2VQX4_TOXCA|nr:hypothetical protein Tcan_11866 [Toxocara canis]
MVKAFLELPKLQTSSLYLDEIGGFLCSRIFVEYVVNSCAHGGVKQSDVKDQIDFTERDSESSGTRSTVEPLLGDYDERSWFGESGVPDPARDPIAQAINLLAKPDTMGNLEALIRFKLKSP